MDIDQMLFEMRNPLHDSERVVKARNIMDEVKKLRKEASVLLRQEAAEVNYKEGDRIKYHGRPFGILGVKVTDTGRIILEIRPMKKNGEWRIHPRANSVNASDIQVDSCDIDKE